MQLITVKSWLLYLPVKTDYIAEIANAVSVFLFIWANLLQDLMSQEHPKRILSITHFMDLYTYMPKKMGYSISAIDLLF